MLVPRKRYNAHLCACHKKHRGDYYTPKGQWLRKLHKNGQRPGLLVLEDGVSGDGMREEMFHISLARRDGLRLLNSTIGGEGATGAKHSPEAREKASRSHLSRLANGAKGKKLTINDAREIRRIIASGVTQTVAAKRFGCSMSTVSLIVLNEIWRDPDPELASAAAALSLDWKEGNACVCPQCGVTFRRRRRRRKFCSIPCRYAYAMGRKCPKPPGWKMSDAQRAVLAAHSKNRVWTEASRENLRKSWRRGNRFTPEVRAKMSAAAKARVARDGPPGRHRRC